MILLQIDWNPAPEIFKIGSFAVRYYSLMFVFAFMLGLYLMKKIFINDNIPIEKIRFFIYLYNCCNIIGCKNRPFFIL